MQASAVRDNPMLTEFLRWDGELARESRDAALYEVWMKQIRLALARRISERYSDHYANLTPHAVLKLLANPDPDLFGADPIVTRDALLVEALAAGRQELAQVLGPDSSRWSWGNLHTIHFRHALDQQPSAGGLLDLGPLAQAGRRLHGECDRFQRIWVIVGADHGRKLQRDSRHQ